MYADIATIRLLSGLTTAEVSDANLTSLIALSDEEVERTTGKKYSSGNTVTEYVNFYQPPRYDDVYPNRLTLKNTPVQSITSFLLLNSDGTTSATLANLSSANITAGTWITADYFLDPNIGVLELTSRTFGFVPTRAKITYTYGYSAVPVIVKQLSSTLATINAWVEFLGGKYNYLQSYSLPEQSYNKGDLFERGKKIIDTLNARADTMYSQLGRKQSSQFVTTGGGYF